jgi:hypothetical protein
MKAPLILSPRAPDSGTLYPAVEICNCVYKTADGDLAAGRTMCSTMPSCENECAIENWRHPRSRRNTSKSLLHKFFQEPDLKSSAAGLIRSACSRTHRSGSFVAAESETTGDRGSQGFGIEGLMENADLIVSSFSGRDALEA